MTMDRPVALSKSGVVDTIKSGWGVFTGHFWKLAVIQFLFTGPRLLLKLGAIFNGWNADLIEGLAEFLIHTFIRGTLIWAVGSAYLRNSFEVKDALRASRRKYLSLLGNTFLVGLIMGIPVFVIIGPLDLVLKGSEVGMCLAMLLILPVFIYISLRLVFMYHSIIFEGQGAYAAIGRSWRLTDGWAERIFGVIFLTALASLVMMLIPIVVGVLFGFLSNSPETILIVDFVVEALIYVVTWPFLIAVITCIYYDIQSRYENVTVYMLTDQLD